MSRLLSVAAVAGLVALTVVITIHVATSTGPNCPGADPAWLGWCENAPAR